MMFVTRGAAAPQDFGRSQPHGRHPSLRLPPWAAVTPLLNFTRAGAHEVRPSPRVSCGELRCLISAGDSAETSGAKPRGGGTHVSIPAPRHSSQLPVFQQNFNSPCMRFRKAKFKFSVI